MEDIIIMAREMGKAIQKDERYQKMIKAKEANDGDEILQGLIGEFNLKRIALNSQINKEEKDQDKIKELNEEIRGIHAQIMQNPNMSAYNLAKTEIDSLMNHVNTILYMSVNGEDPDSVDLESCTGSCATCGGCH